METFPNNKLITCIVPKGQGAELVEALRDDQNVTAANAANGRGVSQRTGNFAEEVDVLTVVVNQSRADDVFAYLYHRIEIDHAFGRFMYQQTLGLSSNFSLPDDIAEEGE